MIWGTHWDAVARDKKASSKRMMERSTASTRPKAKDGAYNREHFFNTPELARWWPTVGRRNLETCNRGGHDPFKVFAAYSGRQQQWPGPT